ncbi:MAG: hypothetical protein CL466_01440 [Acidimicrobiaceae bacterium]|nr:hypothetical protein [Acidimicrobiaceae bacterium]
MAIRRTIQLSDNRARPTTTPRMLAKKIPEMERRRVLTMAAQSARPPVSGWVSILSLIWMSTGRSRKSNSVLMFRARRLSPAWLARNYMVPSTATSRRSCVAHLRTITSRQSGTRCDTRSRVVEAVVIGVGSTGG